MKNLWVLIVICASAHSYAACWKPISAGVDSTISIDNCSISKEGRFRKAWFKWDFNTLQEMTDYQASKYIKAVSLDYFDCAAKKTVSVQVIYYGEGDAGVVDTQRVPLNKAQFNEAPPDTIAETLINYVCKAKK